MTKLPCPYCKTVINMAGAISGEQFRCMVCKQAVAYATDQMPRLVALGPDTRKPWTKPELRRI